MERRERRSNGSCVGQKSAGASTLAYVGSVEMFLGIALIIRIDLAPVLSVQGRSSVTERQ